MCIPKGARNKAAAEMYINFVTETLVARENSIYIGYSVPQQESYDSLPDEIRDDKIRYPDPEDMLKDEIYIALPETTTKLIDSLWTGILSDVRSSPWMTPVMLILVIGLTIIINVRREIKKKNKIENH